MSKVKLYNPAGEATSEVELNPKIFGIEKVKSEVLHQVVVAKLANKRRPIASTKTRGLVRGGGKKPWKQKGTGNARAGSIRSPLWRGGGIIFGPSSARNFSKKLSKTLLRSAIFSALTDKAQGNKIFVVENMDVPSGKTRDLASKLLEFEKKLETKGRVLLVTGGRNEKLELAARNLPNTEVSVADRLDILKIVNSNAVILIKDALPVLEKAYLK